MGRRPRPNLSFFKVLISEFVDRLRIPQAFLKHLPARDLPETTIIRTERKKRFWHVGLQRTEHGYYFSEGWSELVKDLNLLEGEFLIFSLDSSSRFIIVPYDKSGCTKPLNLETHQPSSSRKRKKTESSNFYGDGEPRLVKSEKNGASAEPKGPYFVAKLKRHNRYVLTLPCHFVVDTGLLDQETATLVDPEGRTWVVHIYPRRYKQTGRVQRVDLSKGWHDCRVANRLADGVYCTFVFIGGEGHKIQLHFSAK